ncbi:MAG: hypothetical protein ACI97B_003254 [Verrucomicrobiales bacterium]|jgi:hypothetical protein
MAFPPSDGLKYWAVYWTDEHKQVALRSVICISFAWSLLLSWRLWTGAHQFPAVPVLPVALPRMLDAWLFVGLLLSLSVYVVLPSRTWITAALGCLVMLVLLDQMRLQPWAYQYALMLLPFYFFQPDQPRIGAKSLYDLQRLVVAGVYFWSGVHKLGPGFDHLFRTYLASGLLEASSTSLHPLVLASGHAIPWIEILIGIGLLLRPTARWAGGLAMITHVVILGMIGPLGKDVNSVVWPWNLAMMALVALLFFPGVGIGWRALGQGRLRYLTGLLLLLVGLMPMFSLFSRWDRYLSFHLYSGQQQRIVVFFDKAAAAQLPADIQPWTQASALPGYRELNLNSWAMTEMNVPVVSEDRIMLALAQRIANLPIDAGDWYFHRDYPHLVDQRGWAQYSPQEIRELRRFLPLQLPENLRKK